MNKLQIVQKINSFAGTQGEVDTATGALGYQATMVLGMDTAYKEIQTYHQDWLWMYDETTALLTTAVASKTDAEIARIWRIRYGTKILTPVQYNVWLLNTYNTGEPTHFTVHPATRTILFNPSDQNYTVDIEYQRTPHYLDTNSTIPIIPPEHHDIIVYKALISLGHYLGNSDMIQNYSVRYGTELGELMRGWLPSKTVKLRPFA